MRPLAVRGTVTWGIAGGSPSPCNAAALVWEITLPVGPARIATHASCIQPVGAPGTLYTARAGVGSSRRLRLRRRICGPDSPASTSWR